MSDQGPIGNTPGSAGWANRIQALREMEPSPRRLALFRVADAIRFGARS